MPQANPFDAEHMRYLRLLSEQYPTIQAVCTEIINLNAILNLPKGTEHFMSDLHGEEEAFRHIFNNGSGVIREKVDLAFGHTMPEKERAWFATLIYYPAEKIEEIKREGVNMEDWYSITLYRLVEVCKLTASKYTRSKVRKSLPPEFQYIIDELLHTNYDEGNKQGYYQHIISTIIDVRRADEFIIALATLIKRLAVDRLHIVGDIYDRGPRADQILDMLMTHHNVDIQWGNHDILWMGAAAGSEACIACVLNLALQYNTLDIVENGYGISLRDMITFAQETYKDCTWFMPRNPDDKWYLKSSMDTLSKVHKAVAVIQFKLEGRLIARHPEYKMDRRRLLDKIDYQERTVTIDGAVYPLNDCDFPTVDPQDPSARPSAKANGCSGMSASSIATAACINAAIKTCCFTAASPWRRTVPSLLLIRGRGWYPAKPSWTMPMPPPVKPIIARGSTGSGMRISCGISGAAAVPPCSAATGSPPSSIISSPTVPPGRKIKMPTIAKSRSLRPAAGFSRSSAWIRKSPTSSMAMCR